MHPFSAIYVLFQIDAKTLYNWCRRVGVVPHVDPGDGRRRYLDDEQVLLLARAYRRVVVLPVGAAQLSAYDQLSAEIEDIKKRLDPKT